MNRWTGVAGVLLIVIGACSLAPAEFDNAQKGPQEVTAKLEKSHITVTVGGKPFTCYKFEASQKYPYFWPVNGPASGTSVTTETSEPYPHHHSLFFGCDHVNGGNYWQESNERGQIVSQGPKLIKASGNRVVFTDTCLWQQPGKKPVIRDRRRITITAPNKDLRFIDFEISLKPLTDIRILKTNHALFSARVVPELSVKSGGTLINAEGKTGEKDTFGVASPWCDYSGERSPPGRITEGIAILQHPDNRWYPSKWFTRDYGFFSPTPMYWLKDDHLDLPEGETLTLRYRVVVHTGDATTAGIQKIFGRYKEEKTEDGKQKTETLPSDFCLCRKASCGLTKRSQARKLHLEILRRSVLLKTASIDCCFIISRGLSRWCKSGHRSICLRFGHGHSDFRRKVSPSGEPIHPGPITPIEWASLTAIDV